jgi:D-glucosaminate-6-phosphate ammonia-lyase
VEVVCEIAKPFNVPVLVDAAAENLTIPNVHFQRGATMVAYSGGKAICGPQCAGLLLGPKGLMLSAWQASSPHHGPGRDNKVGKEEMLGMLAAVEAWTTRDHEAEWKRWESWLNHITDVVTKVNGVTTSIRQPGDNFSALNNRAPRLTISWDPDKLHITGEEVAEEVARNKPRLAIGSGGRRPRRGNDEEGEEVNMTSVSVHPSQMQPGEEKIVADRLYGILSQKRQPKSKQLKAPSGNIAGRWKVDIDFSSSKSTHTLFLEQDGNWIQGSHQGDFSVRELVGMIEGNQVKLRSNDRHVADHVTNIFHGKLSGDTITGSIFLGEYLTAEFKATKNPYEVEKNPVVVPGGPPLAT